MLLGNYCQSNCELSRCMCPFLRKAAPSHLVTDSNQIIRKQNINIFYNMIINVNARFYFNLKFYQIRKKVGGELWSRIS